MADKTADNGMGSWQPAQSTGNWGIGNAMPAGQGGAPIGDPWKDKANDGRKVLLPQPGQDVSDLMTSEPIVELDTVRPSNFKSLLIRPDSPAPKQFHGFYDPVRDVTPATKSAPAPDAQGVVNDPWADLGDNGIGSAIDLNDPRIRKFIQHMQITFPEAGFFPGVTDINKVGANEELQPLREPAAIDKHLVVNHFIEENTTVYPIELVNQLHESMHAQGQAPDHNPEVLRVANILDPIQEKLDPKIWDNPESENPRFKSTLIAWVKSAIFGTLKNAGYQKPEDWIKLIVTGSLTTYQWSEQSDLDVSIWVDLNQFEDFHRSEMIKIIIDNLDGDLVPGTLHPIQCFVVDVNEIKSPSEIYKVGVRSAYNLETNEWIVKPERDRSKNIRSQFPDLFRKAKQASAKMKLLLQFQPESAKTYWHFLHKRRRDDMKAGMGDYSESNIVYKMLANDGLFDDISQVTGEHIANFRTSLNWDEAIQKAHQLGIHLVGYCNDRSCSEVDNLHKQGDHSSCFYNWCKVIETSHLIDKTHQSCGSWCSPPRTAQIKSTKHIVQFKQKDESYYASCVSCSWKGPLRPSISGVNKDRRNHLGFEGK